MDAAIMDGMKKIMHKGEQMAPLKSVKLKAKFQKPEVEEKKKDLAKRIKKEK